MEKENEGCLGTKQKYDNIYVDKRKQMTSRCQNDKIEQWVMHWSFKHEVLGAILRRKNKKFFRFLIVSDDLIKLSYLLHDDQLTILSKNPFNNV